MAGLAAARRLALLGHAPIIVAPDVPVPSRGETLSPKALPFLEQLGWGALLNSNCALLGVDRFSVWGSAQLRRSPSFDGAGYHIDRAALESAMARSLVEIERHPETATSIEHLPDGVRLRLANGSQLTAPALIDCTGRAALTSGPASNRKRLDKLTAAWRVLSLPQDTETLAATLIEAVELGWWYVSPMPTNRLMVGLFTDSDLLPQSIARNGKQWAGLLASAPITSARIESLGLLDHLTEVPPSLAPAASVISQHILEGRILRAGDAASALDPLAANGLATALWSGLTAAEAALALIDGDSGPAKRYEQSYLEGIATQLAGQNALYQAELRFSESPFWQRRRSSGAVSRPS